MSERVHAEPEKCCEKITPKTSLEDLAAIVSAHLEKKGLQATLVGGAVVTIDSENEYQSHDLDFISPDDPEGQLKRKAGTIKLLSPTQCVKFCQLVRVNRCFFPLNPVYSLYAELAWFEYIIFAPTNFSLAISEANLKTRLCSIHERGFFMHSIQSEATKLIKDHLPELMASAEELGGVFITGLEGAVAVIGAENLKKKILFQTSFVSSDELQLLDAQVIVQDLLEEHGIEAISEHDFNIAIGAI